MLGPSHALSGAAAWLTASFVAAEFADFHQGPVTMVVGTAMCAGGALVPDLDLSGRVTRDQGGATVAHTFGVVSLFLAECIEKFSLGVYDATKRRRDPRRHNGHRTFTHTLVFNLLLGWGVFEACLHYGKPAVLTTLFLTFAFALRGLFPHWAKRAGWIIVTGAAAWMTWWASEHLTGGRGYPVLGVALGAGGIVHLLGDVVTTHGCPLFWPLPYKRQNWHCFGVPDAIAVKVGGKVEVYVLRTAFFVIGLAAAAGIYRGLFTDLADRIAKLTG
jgi:membrane-bound metal-dependent hydrolase YbcI (DUF457 family)